MSREGDSFDVVVIGAGPVGCASALACARSGGRVLLLEQDPFAAGEQPVGEWLHPPAMDVLEELGVELTPPLAYPTGKGFVLFPDDGTDPVVLPYRAGRFGFSLEHGLLVETLREHAERHERVEYVAPARAARLERDALTFEHRGGARTVRAGRVVGATGAGPRAVARGEVLTFASAETRPSHRVACVTLHGAELPFEGYLHVFVGGPGPAVAYRIGPARVRLLLDVPLSARVPREGGLALYESYAPALPPELGSALRSALAAGAPTWSHGALRPRTELVTGGIAWVGDAAGSYHPLTAIDLTLGLGDARAIARAGSPAAYRRERRRRTRVQESIAVGLHELFADASPETVALRRAVYRLWRADPRERLRTMGFVAGEGESVVRFGRSCLRVMTRGAAEVWAEGARTGALEHSSDVSADLLSRIGWMVGGSLGWTEALPRGWEERLGLRGSGRYGAALSTAEVRGEVVGLPSAPKSAVARVEGALERGVRALLFEQAEDGSFESEIVSSPLLTAKYVLAWHAMARPIDAERRRRVLVGFARAQLPGGAWARYAAGPPDLAATTLVYVAARLLGLAKDDPLLARAHAFIRRAGGALAVPRPAARWLAVVGLYEWDGLGARRGGFGARATPEAHLAAMLEASRHGRGPTATIRAVRDEIFVAPYDEIDFASHAARRRTAGELASRALSWLERTRSAAPRSELARQELRATSHAGASPEAALACMLALAADDARDPDAQRAVDRFEAWIWDDELAGARVCEARSATCDTALAARALAAAAPSPEVHDALRRADDFLRTQQLRGAPGRDPEIDPVGGYSEAGAWHGVASSTATSLAVLARIESPAARPADRELVEAARFLLRAERVGSRSDAFELLRSRADVEDSARRVEALAAFRARYPDRLRDEIDAAVAGGVLAIRGAQRPEGCWRGGSGAGFLYGTMLGVRGLLAAGVPAVDPQIRRACAWLKERQRADGGWGERLSSAREDRYVEHEEAQVVPTAWALVTLAEAADPDFAALERAALLLAAAQSEDGAWPAQDPEAIAPSGVPAARRLYRRCFPLLALGLYVRRARARSLLEPARASARPRPSATLPTHTRWRDE